MTLAPHKKEKFMEALFARLSHYCEIGEPERDALLSLPAKERVYEPGDDIIERGEEPDEALVINEGWAARYIALKDGRSQILNFLLPGDMFDLQVFITDAADHSVAAITKVSLLSIPRYAILDIFTSNHNIGLALWWATLQEEAILREQIVRNGRRNASERVAHLLLELHRRSLIIGEGNEAGFRLPVSQVLISDALGLSFVHVSRVLGKFAKEGLIERSKDRISIKDRKSLIEQSDFSPDYLHLDAEPPRYHLRPTSIRPPEA
ncbi:MAG: Crp/Fnr family transcriptional regulator [Pseudomonadota bacterium]